MSLELYAAAHVIKQDPWLLKHTSSLSNAVPLQWKIYLFAQIPSVP